MIVSIVRHGEAGQASTDRARTLTPAGRDAVSLAADRLGSACDARDTVASPCALAYSPWIRTTQTAEILASRFPDAALQSCSALQPGASVAEVQRELQAAAANACDHLVLVSHQPLVSYLTDYLLDHGNPVPSMQPGAFTTLSLEVIAPGCGQLVFWATPPHYRVEH